MRILTCNVRFAAANDGENSWPLRRELCARIIREQDADIICFQEMQADQHAWLNARLEGYAAYAMTDQPAGTNPQNAIYYRQARFAPVSSGGYWLSTTPHVPGTKSWVSDCVRLANWVLLKEVQSGTTFRVVNTHFDHIGQLAREQQAALIVEDAQAYAPKFPQLLTGDLNCDTRNPAIDVLRSGDWRDTYAAIHGVDDPGPTYHGFQGPAFSSDLGKMDWIMARGQLQVSDAWIVRDSQAGRYPSDHYFVGAEVTL